MDRQNRARAHERPLYARACVVREEEQRNPRTAASTVHRKQSSAFHRRRRSVGRLLALDEVLDLVQLLLARLVFGGVRGRERWSKAKGGAAFCLGLRKKWCV